MYSRRAAVSRGKARENFFDIVSEKVQDIAVAGILPAGIAGAVKVSIKKLMILIRLAAYMQNVMCTKSSPASASGWSYAFEITGTDGTSGKRLFLQ
ncbi:MAG: hypothetical protein ACLTH3_11500 [Lachnospira sp.]